MSNAQINDNDILDALDLKRKRCVRKWTPEEDQEMIEMVKQHGTKMWGLIGSKLKDRSGKQCRERCGTHKSQKPCKISVLLDYKRGHEQTQIQYRRDTLMGRGAPQPDVLRQRPAPSAFCTMFSIFVVPQRTLIFVGLCIGCCPWLIFGVECICGEEVKSLRRNTRLETRTFYRHISSPQGRDF